jgi:hypothetical protein
MKGMGTLGSIWGVAGVLAVVAYAAARLSIRAQHIPSYDLVWYHWAALLLNTVILIYAKSYRAFRLRLAPRIGVKARDIRENPTIAKTIFAPLYCLGYFGSGSGVRFRMISITLVMVGLIVVVRYLPEPWRAVLDFGIAVALALGFVFILTEILLHRPRN